MRLLNLMLVVILLMLSVLLGWSYPAAEAEDKHLLLPQECPECCKKVNLYPGIDVNDLIRIKYIVKYTKFAEDQESVGRFILLDKSGFERTRKWHRYRVILGKQGIDYKDLMILAEPQNVKGLAVLTWMYLDPNRERDNWIWLPSQRKLRRISPADDDDAAFGSDFTNEEVTSRRWEDETYSLVNETGVFEGYASAYTGETYYEGTRGWEVEATPKKDPWYYSRRVLFIPNSIGSQVHDDYYDPNGQKFKEVLKVYEVRENQCIPQIYLETRDVRTGHQTVIDMDWIELNVGVEQKIFSPKAIMRTKW